MVQLNRKTPQLTIETRIEELAESGAICHALSSKYPKVPKEVIEELVQEAFLCLLSHIDRLEGHGVVKSWVLRKAVWLLQSYYRRNGRLDLKEDIFDIGALGELDQHQDVDLEHKRLTLKIRAAIESLDHDAREVLDLFYYRDMIYPEIACHLGVPQRTVGTRLYRSRAKLTKVLEEAGLSPSNSG